MEPTKNTWPNNAKLEINQEVRLSDFALLQNTHGMYAGTAARWRGRIATICADLPYGYIVESPQTGRRLFLSDSLSPTTTRGDTE